MVMDFVGFFWGGGLGGGAKKKEMVPWQQVISFLVFMVTCEDIAEGV